MYEVTSKSRRSLSAPSPATPPLPCPPAGGHSFAALSAAPPVQRRADAIQRDDYSDQAYGIMNSSQDRGQQVQSLVNAENQTLASQGVPPVALGSLPASSPDLGEGNFNTWALDINQGAMRTGGPEGRADAANTVGHEGEHLRQWYEMARFQAGTGAANGPLGEIPPEVAEQARQNPILQSNAGTAGVEQWYNSVYGAGAEYRNQVLNNEDAAHGVSRDMHHEYCGLPEERDAWERGMMITDQFRRMDGRAAPPPALDPSVCDSESLVCQ